MDLLSPEALGGAGLTVGGIGVVAFIRFIFQLGGLKKSLDNFLDEMQKTMQRNRQHQDVEEAHLAEVRRVNARIESFIDWAQNRWGASTGVPRAVGGDHTPAPVHIPDQRG